MRANYGFFRYQKNFQLDSWSNFQFRGRLLQRARKLDIEGPTLKSRKTRVFDFWKFVGRSKISEARELKFCMLKEKYLIRTWLNFQLPTTKISWIIDRHKYTLDERIWWKVENFKDFNKIVFSCFFKSVGKKWITPSNVSQNFVPI